MSITTLGIVPIRYNTIPSGASNITTGVVLRGHLSKESTLVTCYGNPRTTARSIEIYNRAHDPLPTQVATVDKRNPLSLLEVNTDTIMRASIVEPDKVNTGNTNFNLAYYKPDGDFFSLEELSFRVSMSIRGKGIFRMYLRGNDFPFERSMLGGAVLNNNGSVVGLVSRFNNSTKILEVVDGKTLFSLRRRQEKGPSFLNRVRGLLLSLR